MLELVINKEKDIENIILNENGKIVEYYVSSEEDRKRRLEGNIYIAKVDDIIKGMQAAFVDFGGHKKGFIHLKDAIPQVDETKEQIDASTQISKVLQPNQRLLIQIKKDSDDKKGARVSTHISLPGKFIVLMPNTTFITISQKIQDEDTRTKLKKLVKDNLPENCGAIVRTSCENIDEESLKKDIKNLLDKWEEINTKFKKSKAQTKLIFESENIVEKIITDLGKQKLERIITNSKEEYDNLLKNYKSENISIILENEEDLIQKYNFAKQIEKLQERRIWLNCGGFITIDKTEALTAIDVNTGKFTGSKDLEATLFKVNKEATIEIAKQLRLRDIGGIIIIDYIDMKSNENKQKIEKLLKDELKQDRAKTQVEGFTKLNLMELTRKHICSHLNAN